MYYRLSAVMFPIVTLLLIGALIWGYQENQQKNSILIKAENQYQRAFHDLSYHMDKLHNELGNTLAVNSTSQAMQRKGLLNVWRITSEAQSEINQLPLTLMPFNQAEDFLSRISKFSYQTAMRDMNKEPLSVKEVNNLKSLYKSSGEISNNLQKVQNKVINNNLRWMDVEAAIASEHKAQDNTIIDGFKTVDKQSGEYSDLDWGPTISNVYDRRAARKLDGIPMTAEQIKRKALKFANSSGRGTFTKVQVIENGKGTEWSSYTATAYANHKGEKISMDFTRRGGLLISYVDHRNVGPKAVSVSTARSKADTFLKQKGYPHMTAVAYDEYGNLGNFTYVRKQDDVLIYPEKITVRVALDNGDVVGFQASDFIYEHKDNRKIPKPKLTLEQARKVLNPEYKEEYHRLSLIKNEMSQEVLCYEFGGRINGSRYRIFVNSNTGNEEVVEEIKSHNRR
ncbi:germination protein YpeB [Paenibacillus sediminis]|uniref:Spore germination protein n=1 Tax=Paenibacillus sediminis TaxID=664909 RepID=A0ABS4H0D3_9BACL|nr:germination protein YpeB [Paenibacillus sediminis]MBP1935737.1 spore germination protein [Paenibacillus sediminis]